MEEHALQVLQRERFANSFRCQIVSSGQEEKMGNMTSSRSEHLEERIFSDETAAVTTANKQHDQHTASDTMIAKTPQPPHYAVIFTSIRNPNDKPSGQTNSYAETAHRMVELASQQPGFLGLESAREDVGITVSYWSDLDSIKQWKAQSEHVKAQENGQKQWYTAYTTRIALVERDYSF